MANGTGLRKFGIAALAAAVTALTGCGVGEARTSDAVAAAALTPLPVDVALPRKAEILATYHTTTTISSDADASVPARVDGEVVEVLVEEGDTVVAGQVLARLDGERLRLQMRQAKANLDKTTREYERFDSLHERGLVSSSAFEGMQFDMDALQAGYELRRLDYDYTSIRAPISGVVSGRKIKIGQHINSGETTFRIADTSRLVAHLRIPQSEIAKFSAGHLAEVRVDAMPEEVFSARIARISPTIDVRNGTFRATAFLNNDRGLLAPGMFGRFDIAYERHADALLIPAAAVMEEDNEAVVYVVSNGSAVRRIIETGIVTSDIVEVLSGLDEDEQIIVTGQGGLREGSRVLASIPTEVAVIG